MDQNFKAALWKSADKLRAQMDAAEYKHIVLGLIFLKYISDTFVKQREKIHSMVSEPSSDDFVEDPVERSAELENRDYYTQDNVFWVPQKARWETLRSKAKQPDIGSLIDGAMTVIEKKNPALRGRLDKRFGRAQLGQDVLGELIDLISTIGFGEKYDSSDLLGDVYEYFLGQFASAEGKKGGQFYTPSHIVKALVAVLSPNSGRVYDPCCGSGGMFVQGEEFVKAHGGRVDDISIYGQESNPTTWRLAAINLAIRGFSADLGKEPADTFARDQFPDLKFDYIMANPPFNISDWGGEKYENDPRWQFGRPPVGNANYAWLQHILWKLRPGGQAGVVLANGSMSSNTGGEGQIREAMLRGDAVEIMVALPGQLFFNTQISVCLWFLTNDKTANGRDRRGETLFIDARNLGIMETRVLKVFTDEDIAKIADTIQFWKSGDEYEDIAGFCKSASLEEIEKNGFVLTPVRYVGSAEEENAAEKENSGLSFRETIVRLSFDLDEIQKKSVNLDAEIVAHKGTYLAIPPIAQQKAIARILGTLDDKIELNQKMNQTLEETAKAIFRSWFVDFDSVRAKAEGRPTGLPPEISNLFPDELVNSEIGEIPKGWDIEAISDLADCLGGATPSTKNPNFWEGGDLTWTSPKDLSNLKSVHLLKTDRKITEAGLRKISSGLLPVGTVLLSSRAPVGYLALTTEPTAINQGYIALKPSSGVSNYFLLNWCQSNLEEIKNRASGTTFAEISKAAFRPIPAVAPPQELMTKFHEYVKPMYERILLASKEIETLSELRDTLLPKLISGELRIPDAEKFLEEAGI